MANLGLGNLITLKRQLLAASLQSKLDYDAVITAIGQGVAAQFEGFCNRKFERIVGDKHVVGADRDHVYLPRYPLEAVTAVEKRVSAAESWITLTDAVQTWNEKSGLVYLGAVQGHWASHLRITFTGGYWYDTSEDEDGSLPAGATALPADLRHAWYLQCRHAWDSIDKLGSGVKSKPGEMSNLSVLALVPDAKAILDTYVCYAIT